MLFLYLIEQVEFSQLLADVELLYFHREQPQQRELHALHCLVDSVGAPRAFERINAGGNRQMPNELCGLGPPATELMKKKNTGG